MAKYFLIATPERLYLWNQEHFDQADAAPEYSIDAAKEFQPWFRRLSAWSKSDIGPEAFELLVHAWLNRNPCDRTKPQALGEVTGPGWQSLRVAAAGAHRDEPDSVTGPFDEPVFVRVELRPGIFAATGRMRSLQGDRGTRIGWPDLAGCTRRFPSRRASRCPVGPGTGGSPGSTTDLRAHLSELGRSRPHRRGVPASFEALAALLIASAQEEREGLRDTISELLRAAHVIELDTAILRSAAEVQTQYSMSGQDNAIVLASHVIADLEIHRPAPKLLPEPGTQRSLTIPTFARDSEGLGCGFFARFGDSLRYIVFANRTSANGCP